MHVVNKCGFVTWLYDSDSSENDSIERRLERWPYSAIVIEGDSIEGILYILRMWDVCLVVFLEATIATS